LPGGVERRLGRGNLLGQNLRVLLRVERGEIAVGRRYVLLRLLDHQRVRRSLELVELPLGKAHRPARGGELSRRRRRDGTENRSLVGDRFLQVCLGGAHVGRTWRREQVGELFLRDVERRAGEGHRSLVRGGGATLERLEVGLGAREVGAGGADIGRVRRREQAGKLLLRDRHRRAGEREGPCTRRRRPAPERL
jgi:hypothetical protein